jgi:Flp pilus assembly protein TadG
MHLPATRRSFPFTKSRRSKQAYRARNRRGQGLVEVALALPLLLLLLAGVLDLAHAFSVAGILANAAREGARYGATHPTETDTIKTRVVEEAAGAPLTITTDDVQVNTDAGTTTGNPITVRATYTVSLLLSQALGLSDPTVVRTATMAIF